MARLLIIHHTPSPHCQEMLEAVVAGATDPEIEGVEVLRRPALTVAPAEMLDADGYVLGTPANLGYISGALKHAFDTSYYQILDATQGRPFGLWLHGNEGTEGAQRAGPPLWSACRTPVRSRDRPVSGGPRNRSRDGSGL